MKILLPPVEFSLITDRWRPLDRLKMGLYAHWFLTPDRLALLRLPDSGSWITAQSLPLDRRV